MSQETNDKILWFPLMLESLNQFILKCENNDSDVFSALDDFIAKYEVSRLPFREKSAADYIRNFYYFRKEQPLPLDELITEANRLLQSVLWFERCIINETPPKRVDEEDEIPEVCLCDNKEFRLEGNSMICTSCTNEVAMGVSVDSKGNWVKTDDFLSFL